jgi:hypothetical protein
MIVNKDILKELDVELTKEIRLKQDNVLEKLRVKLKQDSYSFQRFNGKFGGKNNTYVDSVNTQFSDFNDFYSQWLKGLIDEYETRLKYGPQLTHNAYLLKDKEIEKFVKIFLERNFYRNLKARTRTKPTEQLWRIWFGYNVVFGLLIAPKYEIDHWNIDKSEIRRADYEYWTLGHIIKEGLIDNDSNEPFKIDSMEKFESIYLSIFKKLSNSKYEKLFYDKYVKYLKKSNNPQEEPFLIPEVRYKGLEHKHIYRLDFTILNPHTHEYVGVEISPSSSHMNISGAKIKKQKDINNELSEKWDKEMDKRNEYFKDFGITIITFTDKMLENIDDCWELIEEKLSARSKDKTSIYDQIERLKRI